MAGKPRISEAQFCIDLGQAATVMRAAWSENKEQPLHYTEEFLSSCLSYPGTLPPIVRTIYEQDRLAAFVFGFDRRVTLAGRDLNLLLMTFFTVAPEFKGRGFGKRVWTECMHKARKVGYDGVFYYCVAGNRSNEVTAAGCREAGYEPLRILSISYLMRLLRTTGGENSETHTEASPGVSIPMFHSAAAGIAKRIVLARKWSDAEVEWQCLDRINSICTNMADGKEAGLITGYVMEIADDRRTACAFIEDVFWDDLKPSAKSALLNAFLARCASGAKFIVMPVLGYVSTAPFFEAGFRRSTRVLNAYLTLWDRSTIPAVNAMYMDVL